MAVPLNPLASYVYIQHETSRTCLQPRPSFAWILPLRNIICPIVDQQSWSILKCPFLWKDFMALFHEWGSTASRLEWEPLWGGSLLFISKFPEKLLVLIFYQPLKNKQHKYWNLIQKKGVSVVAKMLFPQVDEGFWLYYTSFWYKISKLILCFSILLLYID